MFRLSSVLAIAASLASADSYPRQTGVDVEHYVFAVSLRDDSAEITGETTVRIKFLNAGLSEWSLDLASGMVVSGITSSGMAVRYAHRADRLRVQVAPPSTGGEERAYVVRYRGLPSGGLRMVKNKFGERTWFSANWPDLAHQWLPTVDHPYDKATSEFIITAPAQYQVVANGLLVEQVDLEDGRRTTHWKQSVPIATWQNNIGVARFAWRWFDSAAGVPLETWVFRKDRDNGAVSFEEPTRQAMKFYDSAIGPYPYEKLADVEAAGMNGGMEHASAIFFGESLVTDRPASRVVWHEIAHQWFGDSVTEKDWDDVWLSEGFATYFALLASEHIDGREALVKGLEGSRAGIFAAEKRMPGVAVVQDKAWQGIPNEIVYQKGAWVLHMLRGVMGDRKFWEGIREYYRRYRDSNASTADMQRVMMEVAGTDLGWFFREWLYRAGSPVVEGGWHYDGAKVSIDLEQTQPGEPYRLPIEIAVGDRIMKVEMTAKRQNFEIPAARQPPDVVIDPNTWLLANIRFSGPH